MHPVRASVAGLVCLLVLVIAVSVSAATARAANSQSYAPTLFDLVNQYRAEHGVPHLVWDSRLAAAADFHNRWMRDHGCYAHECPGEPGVAQRFVNAGLTDLLGGAENIGKGFLTAQDMFVGWRDSASHRAHMLNRDYNIAGVAFLPASDGNLWTLDLARVASVVPPPPPVVVPTPTPPPPPPTVTWPAPTPPPAVSATLTPAPPSPLVTPSPRAAPTATPSVGQVCRWVRRSFRWVYECWTP